MKKSLIITLAIALFAVLSCARQEPLAPEEYDVALTVGKYPAFEDGKAIGTPDPGKTEWENGDVLYIVMQTSDNPVAARYRATKKSGSWNNFEKFEDGSYTAVSSLTAPGAYKALVFYSPAYEFNGNEVLSLQKGKYAGVDEFLQWCSGNEYDITGDASLKVNFVKDYSRIRAVTEQNYTTKMKADGFIPAGYQTKPLKDAGVLEAKADANGNAFYYGTWPEGTSFDVSTYDTKGAYAFNNAFMNKSASVNGTSYALDCQDSGEYTTIAKLSAKATKSGKTFNVKVKNAVVSYTIGQYAHLEDGSGAIMVFVKNHGLQVGQSITGTISGTVKLYNSSPQITALNYSSATVTAGAYVPCTEMTVAELLNDFSANIHRRILLKDITVDTGISKSSRNGNISQGGSTINIYGTYSASPAVIETDKEGNLIAFPTVYNSTKQLSIYESSQFTEVGGGDPEDTAFAKLTKKGFYSNTNTDNPVAVMLYSEGDDQYSFGTASSTSFYHQFNLDNGTYGLVDLSTVSYKIGREFGLTSNLNGVVEDHTVKVVNKNSSMAWLEDKTNNVGYIIALK